MVTNCTNVNIRHYSQVCCNPWREGKLSGGTWDLSTVLKVTGKATVIQKPKNVWGKASMEMVLTKATAA